MSDIPARVQKLIALAGSPVEEEARTAAWLACKLIRDNGLRVVGITPWEPRPYVEPAPPPSPPAESGDPPKERRITARFDSFCKACRKPIKKGEWVFWTKGFGAKHEACGK